MTADDRATRILYVAATADTARQTLDQLAAGDDRFEFATETNPEDVPTRVHTETVDCILSEYDLRGTDGIALLETVREQELGVPFILCTDCGSERVASRAISAGVTDYVQTDRAGSIDTLADRICAVTETAADAGSHGQATLDRFMEVFPDVVFVIDEDGQYRDVLASGDDSLLYDTPDRLVGERFEDVLPAETARQFHDALGHALDTDDQYRFEYQLDVQSGSRWFEARVVPLDTDGKPRTVFWLARDITERKRRQHEYEQIFDSVNDAITVFDPEAGAITQVNEAYREMLGYDLDAIQRLGIGGLSAGEDGYTGARGWELIRETAASGGANTVTWRAETKSGERLWLEATLTPAEIGGDQRVLSIQRDITERKRREQAIQRLETATEQLQTATTRSDVGAVAVEAAGDILGLPHAVCWFQEADAEQLTPVAASDAARNTAFATERTGGSYEYKAFQTAALTQYTPRAHNPALTLETGVLLPIPKHGLLGVAASGDTPLDDTVLDIAKALADHVTTAVDRVEREQAVRERERRFRLIAERIDEVIYLANTDFTEVLYVNPAYETIWGRPRDDLYADARKFIEAIDARDREATEAEIEAMIAELDQDDPADSYEFEYRIRRPDGEVRWVSATGYAVDMYGGERRFVGIVNDITERKYREQRLEVFNRILRHNLRNNLDIIRSHAETLAARTETEHADRIMTAVDELAAIGNRARHIDRIMSMDDETTAVDLPETLHELVAGVGPDEHAVAVRTDCPESATVTTDRDALQTAVRSAVENALEHAESTVTVRAEDTPAGYSIVVSDDGPGIPEEQLVPIKTGTETDLHHVRGLGLWQLRWAVDKLNGDLSFETDGGTTVRIGVPDRSSPE
jgi:PAS domain S-box-containing protein